MITYEQKLAAALESYQAGRYREAEAQCLDMVQKEPGQPEVLHLLGVILYQAGRFDDAVERLQMAVRASPENDRYRLSLGAVWISM